MTKVMFINHCRKQCGIYQYGKRMFDILHKSNKNKYHYMELNNASEYDTIIKNNDYTAIIYNYNLLTMSWLNQYNICNKRLNIGIVHESDPNFFCKIISIDPTIIERDNIYTIPRPIFEELPQINNYDCKEFEKFCAYHNSDKIIFGSFGFGFNFKGFHSIVKMINQQYDNAIIKFLIPTADFDTNGKQTTREAIHQCKNYNIKNNIELMIYTEFVSENDLLRFLISTDMNIFLYDKLEGRGISSTIDYALSVPTPFGISDSNMFHHIYSDEICLYKNSIEQCMTNGIKYCSNFKKLYSHENMITKWDSILQTIV